MLSNRSMPASTVLPELAYPDVQEAVHCLCNAFGFTLRIGMGGHRAQLNAGDGALILIERSKKVSLKTAVMIRVENVDAHYEQVRNCEGMRIRKVPTTYQYGERQYNVEDFAGHHWCVSQSVANVDPKDWGGTPGQL